MSKYLDNRPECVCDTECLYNYWSIGFKTMDGKRTAVYELFDGNPLTRQAIASVFRKYRVFTFNGIKYDIPMILYAMTGVDNKELKNASDQLIQFGVDWWTFLDRFELRIPHFFDYVDLMPVSPGSPQMPSLKLLGGRLHSRKLQEMPIPHDAWVDEDGREVIRSYNINDLDTTIDLANDLKPQVALRALMSDQYGVDVRSKSDAQVAEAVIKAEVEKITGKKLYAPKTVGMKFHYKPPAFVKFKTQQMRDVLEMVERATFIVTASGKLMAPPELDGFTVTIGISTYTMGIGGLHSKESSVSYYEDEDVELISPDVVSYYPSTILVDKMSPKQIGPVFLAIYKSIFDRRVAAKKAGDKNTAETLKIVLNGVFGKLGSPYSVFYAPDLLIQTTLTGQLAIFTLVEAFEVAGMSVVSANTDGMVVKCPRHLRNEYNNIISSWQQSTGFLTEETLIRSIHCRDVNSYVLFEIQKDGSLKVKAKGAYGASGPGLPGAAGQKKNPSCDVCNDAVIAYLQHGTSVEDTIDWCSDPRKFLSLRRVTGGAVKDDVYLGKVLRWYYAKGVSGGFNYETNGNLVPDTIGAKLMMELDLPAGLPADIDYDWYYREAYAMLDDLGVDVEMPDDGRRGMVLARQEKQKNIHMVDLKTKVAYCGMKCPSRRDPWVEYKSMPDGHRLCSKCKKGESL